MENKPLGRGPSIARNPAHAAIVAVFQKLRQSEIESFFVRSTGSHITALFLREVTKWFMPPKGNAVYPRTTFYRDGFYWFGQTRQTWLKEHELTRRHLETSYSRSAKFLVVNHFMLKGLRTTFYRFDFEKLLPLIEGDQKVQALLLARNTIRPSYESSAIYPAF